MKKIITEPFDRNKIPPRQAWWGMPVVWIWSLIATFGTHLKIHKENTKGLKPPYILLGSHHAFNDFCVTPLAIFPHRANYVSELEGFKNYGEWPYRQVGCLGTRKFVNDIALVRNIKNVLNRGDILVMYPEARYANVGTSSELPVSVGKLVKLMGVPLVTLNMHGNYLQQPIWNLKMRKGVNLEAEMKVLFTSEELKTASVDEINNALKEALSYDEYKWQLEQKMKIDVPFRAEGLHMPLYKCRSCQKEGTMQSKGSEIFCTSCGASWNMNEYGQLESKNSSSESCEKIHIPDWYEWERKTVEDEIKNGNYKLDCLVHVESLPNAKNFINCGTGHLIHNADGFYLTFKDYGKSEVETLFFASETLISLHTEYAYRDKYGMCITLATLDNTYYLFPKQNEKVAAELSAKHMNPPVEDPNQFGDVEEKYSFFNPTKIQFATEYFYKLKRKLLK